jgi:hypothetical protein
MAGRRPRALLVAKELLMTRDEWYQLTAELIAAEEAADPRRLAAIAWRLYGEAGSEQAEIEELQNALRAARQAHQALSSGAVRR